MAKKSKNSGLEKYPKDLLKRIRVAVEKNIPVMLRGHTGTGKTHLVEKLAENEGKILHRINFTGQSTTEDMLGKHLADTTRGVYWVDGLITRAMRNGEWVVLDELNMALPEILSRLHSIVGESGTLVLTEKDGEIVQAHPDFRVFGTMNPSGEYMGTKELNGAFLSRWVIEDVEPAKDEVEIIANKGGVDMAVAGVIQKVLDEVRKAKEDGRVSFFPSTRDAIFAGTLIASGISTKKALYCAMVAKASTEERQAVRKLVDLIVGDIEKSTDPVMTYTELLDELAKTRKALEEAMIAKPITQPV